MNNFNPAINSAYDPGMLEVGTINPMAGGTKAIMPGNGSAINMNQVKPSMINPKLFSNMETIQGLNPGSVYNQSQPIMPPSGVQTSITPILGTENQ
jgi:hypothetical protein